MPDAHPTARDFERIEQAALDAIALVPTYLQYSSPPAPSVRCGHGTDTACAAFWRRDDTGCTTQLTFLAPREHADA